MGFYISIPGTVTYANNEQLREVVRGIKIERLLLETDCPYLAPVPHRGKRNEPAYLRITAEKVAELKGLSVEDVGRITSLNAKRLFGFGQEDQAAEHRLPDQELPLPEHHQPLLQPLLVLRQVRRFHGQGAFSQARPRT